MKLALLHISDIHFKHDKENLALDKAPKIKAALQSVTPDLAACFIVITGDVAYSGKKAEYKIAQQFFSELRELIQGINPSLKVESIFVPGNHDCDFERESDVRPLAMSNMLSLVEKLDPSGNTAKECLDVQDEFFKFEAGVSNNPIIPKDKRLYYERSFEIGGKTVRFNCYNTAWVSRIPEPPGQLVYPTHVAVASSKAGNNYDVEISIMHHPYNWLEPNNGSALKKHLHRTTDIILTGHEHETDAYIRIHISGEDVFYTEGAALQEHKGTRSGFNVILIDLKGSRQKVFQFEWKNDQYVPRRQDPEWDLFVKNKFLTQQNFENNEKFTDELTKVGTGFTHSNKKEELRLRDIFIYPDLAERSLSAKLKIASPSLIEGEELLEYIAKHKHVLIIGADSSGKTALAKTLYRDLQRVKKLVPIFLSGNDPDFDGPDEDQFTKGIRRAYIRQYSEETFIKFSQLDSEKKVLVVDNFNRSKFKSRKGQNLIIELARKAFGTVILFADDLFRIEELTYQGDVENSLLEFQHCTIKQFGLTLRYKLIRKWVTLGQDYNTNDDDINRQIAQLENIVSTTLGKNVLPSYPVTILILLQTWEAHSTSDPDTGSYGHLYEALITDTLSKASNKVTDVNTKYTYISRIAYYLFDKEQSYLTEQEMRDINREYLRLYSIDIRQEKMIQELEQARILRQANGGYKFNHNYIFYYFVAKYFQDNLREKSEEAKLREQLRVMTDNVYYEQYARILMFLVYLTKDQEIIERMLHNAKEIYGEYKPCDLEEDVAFINKAYKEVPKLVLPPTALDENREKHRKKIDEADGEDDFDEIEYEREKIKYDKDLSDLVKINIAFKTLQIIGQILRNFPGSLRSELKLEITLESYRLGLRVMRAALSIAERNWEQLQLYYSLLLKEQRAGASDIEVMRSAESFVTWLTQSVAYGVIKRISYSVGLEELDRTYQEVLHVENADTSTSMIDLSIKLDHFSSLPENEIRALHERLEGNIFTHNLLRDLVYNYMYLFPCPQSKKQSLGKLLNIETNNPKLLDNRSKKMLTDGSKKK